MWFVFPERAKRMVFRHSCKTPGAPGVRGISSGYVISGSVLCLAVDVSVTNRVMPVTAVERAGWSASPAVLCIIPGGVPQGWAREHYLSRALSSRAVTEQTAVLCGEGSAPLLLCSPVCAPGTPRLCATLLAFGIQCSLTWHL